MVQNGQKMAGLTLRGPDVPAWHKIGSREQAKMAIYKICIRAVCNRWSICVFPKIHNFIQYWETIFKVQMNFLTLLHHPMFHSKLYNDKSIEYYTYGWENNVRDNQFHYKCLNIWPTHRGCWAPSGWLWVVGRRTEADSAIPKNQKHVKLYSRGKNVIRYTCTLSKMNLTSEIRIYALKIVSFCNFYITSQTAENCYYIPSSPPWEDLSYILFCSLVIPLPKYFNTALLLEENKNFKRSLRH